MQHVPDADEVRTQIAALDERDRKVLGGLVVTWIAAPERIRDREWVSEQFVQLAIVALGAGNEGPATTADVERVRHYARDRMPAIEAAAMSLFLRLAADLRARGSAFTFADAQACVRDYLAK